MRSLRTRSGTQTAALILAAALFVAAGINHFRDPNFYLPAMPLYLPWPLALIYVSGAFEILGGLAILWPSVRRLAGWGLIALLVAVFPANLHMAFFPEEFVAQGIPVWALYLRLPVQAAFIAWIYSVAASRGAVSDNVSRAA